MYERSPLHFLNRPEEVSHLTPINTESQIIDDDSVGTPLVDQGEETKIDEFSLQETVDAYTPTLIKTDTDEQTNFDERRDEAMSFGPPGSIQIATNLDS